MSQFVKALSFGQSRILVNYYDYPVKENNQPVTFPGNDQLVKVSNWIQSVEVINVNTMQRVELSYQEIDQIATLINEIKQEQVPPISLNEFYSITC
jgi:hypothetical protein